MNAQLFTVRDVYREYLQWARSLLVLAEKCSVNEWPERKNVLENVFRLQLLYNERESIRFEFLVDSGAPGTNDWRSLSKINTRLVKEWMSVEEARLTQGNSTYKNVLKKIESLEGKVDSPKLDQPFQGLSKNRTYLEARTAFSERIKLLDKKLSR